MAEIIRTRADELAGLQMIENGKGILRRRGFARESIRGEVYWAPQRETG